MNLVGQAAGYIASRQPAPKAPKAGRPGLLNPMQFAGNAAAHPGGLPTGTVPWRVFGGGGGAAAGEATGGGVAPLIEDVAAV